MEVGPTGGAGHAHAAAQAKPDPAALESKAAPIAETASAQPTESTNPNAGQNLNVIA